MTKEEILRQLYGYDSFRPGQEELIEKIILNRSRGKTHHIIINAEGIGHSTSMAKRIEAATGIETRATILGHMQRGGSPSCRDRFYGSLMGAYAVDLLLRGETKRIVGIKSGEIVDFDINEGLSMKKQISKEQFEIAQTLSYSYGNFNLGAAGTINPLKHKF